MRLRLLLTCLGASVLAMSNLATATTMLPLDLPALTQRAEAVVAGKVTLVRSAWTSGHDAIYTDVTIHVDRVLAGNVAKGADVIVRREGGTVDGIGMKVHGAAAFGQDEDVVVFVEHRGPSLYVVGMAQGKLQLYRDASTGARMLRRNLAEVSYTRAATPAERTLSTQPTAKAPSAPINSLDDLAAEVARLKNAAQRP